MNSLQPSAFNLAPSPTLQWQPVRSANFLAIAGRSYPVNTTSAAITVTLPLNPNPGDQITLTDYAGTFATNNLTINPNGGKIRGSTSNAVINTSNNSVQLVYVDSTQGWLVYSAVSGTPFLSPPTSINYVIVAAGGGGGRDRAAGGGAGGYRTDTALNVSPGVTYTINVGAGGAGSTGAGVNPTNGGHSYIQGTGITASPAAPGNPYANAITSFGGGSGASINPTVAVGSGGSGGGGSGQNLGGGIAGGAGNTPNTLPSQGNDGGSGSGAPNSASGGGGGAGGTGSAGVINGGAGGNGIQGPSYAASFGGAGPGGSPSTGYFSGGGGGGANAGNGGAGGYGGGGAGGNVGSGGIAGGTNTGGGGGGGGGSTGAGAAGGSGIVIIAYPSTYLAATSTTGSPTVTISGGNRIYAFTGNGSITF